MLDPTLGVLIFFVVLTTVFCITSIATAEDAEERRQRIRRASNAIGTVGGITIAYLIGGLTALVWLLILAMAVMCLAFGGR